MMQISNVSSLQLFQAMRFGTLLLIGVVLVKAGFNPDEISLYELFFFIANVVSFFWVMGLNNALISYFPSLSNEKQKSVFFNLGMILMLIAFLGGGLVFILDRPIAALLRKTEIPNLSWIVLYMFLSAAGNFTEYIYLLKERSKAIVIYGGVLFSLQLALIFLGIACDFRIEGLLKLMVLWAGCKFIWFWITVAGVSEFKIDFRFQWVFLGFAIPLIIHMLLGNGMEYVDGFLVQYFFEDGMFTIYRYGARELPLISILVGSISTALIPAAVDNMEAALEEVRLRILRLSMIIFPISIVLMMLSPGLFQTFYSEDYLISAKIFNIYLLVLTSRVLMPQVVIFARHRNRVLMISALVELVVNVTLSIWFLQLFGILGIAWATVLAYLLNKMILMAYSYVRFRVSPSQYLSVRTYFLWTFLLLASYLISLFYLGG